MKLYIKEKVEKTVDGEELVTVEVYKSECKPLSYIVFTEKANKHPLSILAKMQRN